MEKKKSLVNSIIIEDLISICEHIERAGIWLNNEVRGNYRIDDNDGFNPFKGSCVLN